MYVVYRTTKTELPAVILYEDEYDIMADLCDAEAIYNEYLEDDATFTAGIGDVIQSTG